MAASFTHPLDVIKVRMQTREHPSGRRPPTLQIIRASIQEFGLKSLYAGLTASLMRQMSYSLVRLGSYETVKGYINKDGAPSVPKSLLAASLAGALGGVAGNPADVVLVRMTSDLVRPPEQRYGYGNGIRGLFSIIREEGVKGLSRGIGTNVTRAILMNASQVGSYDFFKTWLLANPVPLTDHQMREGLFLHVVASTLAGTVATTVCSPADVVRSRVMASTDKGPLEVIIGSVRQEGVRFLFKGWTPAFVRLAPNTVLLFVFFEQLKLTWKKAFSSD